MVAIGLDPDNERGRCFRCNWFRWRKLWHLCVRLCQDILGSTETATESGDAITYYETEAGLRLDGLVLPKEKAVEMGRRLLRVVEDDEEWAGGNPG